MCPCGGQVALGYTVNVVNAGIKTLQVGAAARAEGEEGAGGELAQLVESLATNGDVAAASAARFGKGDKVCLDIHWSRCLSSICASVHSAVQACTLGSSSESMYVFFPVSSTAI